LEILEEEKYINYMNGEVSGSKYKSIMINNICNTEWNTEIMPSLARMFRYHSRKIIVKKDIIYSKGKIIIKLYQLSIYHFLFYLEIYL